MSTFRVRMIVEEQKNPGDRWLPVDHELLAYTPDMQDARAVTYIVRNLDFTDDVMATARDAITRTKGEEASGNAG